MLSRIAQLSAGVQRYPLQYPKQQHLLVKLDKGDRSYSGKGAGLCQSPPTIRQRRADVLIATQRLRLIALQLKILPSPLCRREIEQVMSTPSESGTKWSETKQRNNREVDR